MVNPCLFPSLFSGDKIMIGKIAFLVLLDFVSLAPIEIRTNIDQTGLEFLSKFGYLTPPDPRTGKLLDEKTVAKAIKILQRMGGLTETGILNNETKILMQSPRCGMPDFAPTDNAKRKRRYKKHGVIWYKKLLTWRLGNSNNDKIDDKTVKDTMSAAMKKWSTATNLDFKEINTGTPDIWVRFAKGYHSDPFAFDGPGGTLAHAFYPASDALAGDVHFDDDEKYTVNSPHGKSLLWVAVHELGHSIGLDHSNVKGAVMYPWYQSNGGKDFDLTLDDVKGAQSLYGERVKNETVRPSLPPVRFCLNKFKAVYMDYHDKRTYIINGPKSYIMDRDLKMEKGPIVTAKLFGGIDNVDAVFQRQWDSKAVIFNGNKYYIFQGTKLVKGPDYISSGFEGLPKDFKNIDAAFVWPGNNQLYIFRGREYWRFQRKQGTDIYRLDYGYPRLISRAWRNIPDNIDSVFAWRNGKTYFFKSDKYYRLNDRYLRVAYGYPRSVTQDWTGCPPALIDNNIKDAASPMSDSSMLIVILIFTTLCTYLNV